MSRIGRRVAIALGWFVVAWIVAYLAAPVFFGSANVLLPVIAVSVGVGAHVVLLIRDRRRAAGHHPQTCFRVTFRPWRIGLRLLSLVLVVAACSATPSDGPVALRTAQAGSICPSARVGGILVADSTYGLAFRGGGNTEGVVWPAGYSARRESGVVLLIDPKGQVVAREGDRLAAAGAAGADGLSYPCTGIHVEATPSA